MSDIYCTADEYNNKYRETKKSLFKGGQNMNAEYMAYREMRIVENRKRRMRIVRHQRIALALIVAVLIFLITFVTAVLMSSASSNEIKTKRYTNLTVSCGDTLWSIADRYMTEEYDSHDQYIKEVCGINHLSEDDVILAGTNVIIPYYK